MWLFFCATGAGREPDKVARLLSLFSNFELKLNLALDPSAAPEVIRLANEARGFVQVVSAAAGELSGLSNYFPAYVGARDPGNEFLLVSAPLGESVQTDLPSFPLEVGLPYACASGREFFQLLAERNREGLEYTGLEINLGGVDFAQLEDFFPHLYKRGIPTLFYSDMVPGFSRYHDGPSGHV